MGATFCTRIKISCKIFRVKAGWALPHYILLLCCRFKAMRYKYGILIAACSMLQAGCILKGSSAAL
jgi:hypothetical protein